MYEPDPALIRAASAGDTAAFEELVRAYQAHVWRFLRHLLGDAALAEDITQETFVRVYRKLETFRFRSKFSTWVFSVIDLLDQEVLSITTTTRSGSFTAPFGFF